MCLPIYTPSLPLAELQTSNLLDFNGETNQHFFFRLQPTLLAYWSLRNSEYNQEEMLVVPVDFSLVKIKRIWH
jgi:hypothetical protein